MRLYVPDDSAARSVGADEVAAALAARLPGAEIVRTGSRGALWLEPMVEVETPEGRIAYGPATPDDAPGLAEVLPSAGPHPLRLGRPEDLPWFADQERLTFARCGIIAPLDLAAYEAHGGLAGLRAALGMEPSAICAAVLDSGLRGRGGAGFPTGIKWKTVHEQTASRKHVCCNADEGDSGAYADRMLMEGDPFLLIEGMAIAGLATGATEGWIYIRSEYPEAIARMTAAIEVMERAGWLGEDVGGSGRAFRLRVRRGAGAYICGEESSMLNSIEGRRGVVRAKPPIPAIQGLFGEPTVVNNVLTLAAGPLILSKGPEFYRDFGMGRSTGTQPFTLGGNVARGGLIEKAFGVTVRELIEGFGGGTASGRSFRTAQLGGPLGAYVCDEQLDLPMDYEALAEAGAMLGHGGITVFDDTVDMGAMARFAFEFCEIESCGKCTPCRVGATRGRETVEKILRGENVAANMVLVEDLCELMRDGSLCAMGGLTPMPVLSALRLFPEDFDRAPAQAAE
ncbi:NADH-ubiquinone oxidoreductase-F iron-sulfur binding region domain-containing protein [Albimonas sp. CAU 1670]|uniref:formate dehydrogenase beta subunit n=1 Tax=Albimonas sp. CAU 1670 TaxID=3032599 RepID=UPI0023DCC529|nr:formate dehydrogenase beta subunit [Albimonas sp. CAU 1670]MDF2233668.1 NADH-ubiquinone oxidoreductase-F iron-sulfur binding region domain-containing protein [Albimonas sp. CAU 1670]